MMNISTMGLWRRPATWLAPVLTVLALLAGTTGAQAQRYQALPVTGFTADVVANGTNVAVGTCTTADFDAAGYYLMEKGYSNPTGAVATQGLPQGGLINSALTPGLPFQLASYSASNSLRLPGGSNGTLTLTRPVAATALYVLAATGSGNASMNVTVTFVDGTTQVFNGQPVPDWFGGGNYAILGLGRVNPGNSIDNNNGNPRLYQTGLTLGAANQSKLITRLDFANAGGGILNVMGVSGDVAPNNALAFDGVDDYVGLGSPASLSNLGLSGATLEAWVYLNSTGLGSFIRKDGDYNFLVQPGGQLYAEIWNLGTGNAARVYEFGTVNLTAGQWNHVAATWNGTTLRLFLNGVDVSGTQASSPVPTGSPLWLGRSSTYNNPLNGRLDEVRIYNTALTLAQIQADQFNTASALPANLKYYANFDQGTAGGTNTGLTSLTDQSGNGSTGTLTNFALTGTSSNWVRSFPTITGISPTSGQVSSSVTVTGTNLLDATGFKFNGTAVSPFTTPTNDLSATVTVPSGATTGPVSVSSATLTLYNGPAFTVTATTAVTWTGAVSTDWATAGNWSPAVVPTSSIDVTIPSAPANQPLVSGAQAAKNVTVQTGARLTLAATTAPLTQLTLGTRGSLLLASGSTLTQAATSEVYITGSMTNNGATFTLDPTSEIGFGGSPHMLNGTAGVTFQILTVGEQGFNDDLSIQVPVQVRRKLGVYNNSSTSIGPGGSLTLLSDATGTALVENGTGSLVGGPVTVQRYIDPTLNAGPGYRHYSAPVSNTTVGDLATTGSGGSFAPTLTTSYNASPTPGTTTPFPTVFGYDETRVTLTNSYAPFDRGFVVPAALTTPLAVGRGYAVNIAGTQLVDFVGTLTNGDQPALALSRVASNTDAGWQLLGNPYPAPLDYGLVAAGDRTGLDAAMYVYSSTGPYAGNYRSYLPPVGANPGIGNGVLPVAQGFFVRVSSGQTSGTLTFRNAQRLTAPNATAFQRTTADPRPLVQLELRGATGPADGLYAYATAGATPAFDPQFDAEKLANPSGLNLSSTATSGQRLAIDGRPVFDAATVLPLAVGVPAAGTYTFAAVALNNLPAGLDAYLFDAQTGQSVNLRTQPAYTFSVTPAQATALLVGRFALRFTATALATAPALTAAQVQLYPNPAHARFTVLMPGVLGAASVQAELVNTLGQVVRRQSAALPASGATLTVETGELAAGVYTLRLLAGPTTLAKRVVIQ